MGGPKGKAGGEYQPKKFNSHFNSPFTLRTIFALLIEYEGVKPRYIFTVLKFYLAPSYDGLDMEFIDLA